MRLYVVLSSKKADTGPKKGKGAEIERWEADIRKSLADKKAANTTTLSKQDQAAVQAQLEKETITRIRVADIRNRIIRGLQFIHTLVGLNIEQFRSHISVVSSLLLEGTLGRRSILVGEDAVLTFLVRSKRIILRSLIETFLRTLRNVFPHVWIAFNDGLARPRYAV